MKGAGLVKRQQIGAFQYVGQLQLDPGEFQMGKILLGFLHLLLGLSGKAQDHMDDNGKAGFF